MKRKFSVYGVVSAGKYLGDFEAETKEEAIKLALESEAASVSLCHQCAGECEDPEIHDAIACEVQS